MARALLLCLFLILPLKVQADEFRLAVAANMLPAARVLADAFTNETGHRASIAHGATGRLFTQITQGAPFDIFLSADQARPELLEQRGLAVARRTYAIGRLALVGSFADGDTIADAVRNRRIAIADPNLAPYGVAAIQVLDHAGVAASEVTLLLADNVGQAAVWVETGNAQLGFVARSQIDTLLAQRTMQIRTIPVEFHDPILQDAVLLPQGADNIAATAFWDWMGGPSATDILVAQGYDIP